jgi:hypothetical protein
MSKSMSVRGFTGKDSDEYKKHYEAVLFCIEKDLSFPKETVAFFEGKVEGSDGLGSYQRHALPRILADGFPVKLPLTLMDYENKIVLKTKDIPKEVTEIVVTLDY